MTLLNKLNEEYEPELTGLIIDELKLERQISRREIVHALLDNTHNISEGFNGEGNIEYAALLLRLYSEKLNGTYKNGNGE